MCLLTVLVFAARVKALPAPSPAAARLVPLPARSAGSLRRAAQRGQDGNVPVLQCRHSKAGGRHATGTGLYRPRHALLHATCKQHAARMITAASVGELLQNKGAEENKGAVRRRGRGRGLPWRLPATRSCSAGGWGVARPPPQAAAAAAQPQSAASASATRALADATPSGAAGSRALAFEGLRLVKVLPLLGLVPVVAATVAGGAGQAGWQRGGLEVPAQAAGAAPCAFACSVPSCGSDRPGWGGLRWPAGHPGSSTSTNMWTTGRSVPAQQGLSPTALLRRWLHPLPSPHVCHQKPRPAPRVEPMRISLVTLMRLAWPVLVNICRQATGRA